MNKQVFNVTHIFRYLQDRSLEAGLFLHYDDAKETIQLFLKEDNDVKRIGAIQYEGSNDYEVKEPHIVSWRFERETLINELKEDLEQITSYRRDKNTGPAVNPEAQSIAFKLEELNDEAKITIDHIVKVFRKYTN
jgi:uncharacterized coiled-coil DUF342 family protein